MATITFITRDDKTITLEGDSGSLMKLAKDNGVPGIEGECGGVCSCATCHCHIDPAHTSKTGDASEIEQDLLELNDHADEFSRLTCQIQVSDALDGLVLKVAEKEF